jgi:hypothetical protein
VRLTPEDLAKLETKKLANIIRKLNSGKTLTGREEEILSRARSDESTPSTGAVAVYAHTWEELADAIPIDRRTLTNFRDKFAKLIKERKKALDRADGRHCITEWRKLLEECGVEGRGVNNPDLECERELKRQKLKLDLERSRFEFEKEKDKMLPVAQFEAALGQMLAMFRQSLDAFPPRIAGNIDEADSETLLVSLKAAAPKDLPTLYKLIKSGKVKFTDYHARVALIEAEVELLKATLRECKYLEASPDVE